MQKKFEILQVLNLLEKTKLRNKDLMGRRNPELDMDMEYEKMRQKTQQHAIYEAIQRVDSERMLQSQRKGEDYQRVVQKRLSDLKKK